MTAPKAPPPFARLPFFYGWVIIAIAFVTMALSVTARTSFSLLLPPILVEFGWDRGMAAGAFSFGFLFFALISPFVGRIMDAKGPRFVVEVGVVMLVSGLMLSVYIREPWQLYLTLGLLVGCGANCMSYTAQSLFLPNWFVRRRGLAISLAFSGVGIGAILLLPWFQSLIETQGWRAACWSMGLLCLVILAPINLFIWKRPQDIGLQPDGEAAPLAGAVPQRKANVVNAAWAEQEWTLRRAMRSAPFWWLVLGYFCALFAWYAVQIHQTKYLVEIGFKPLEAAWALGIVSIVGIPGQIILGTLSDRYGREGIWMIGCGGFALCYLALIAMEHQASPFLLYAMVLTQGFLGYGMTPVMAPMVAELYEGPHYGTIFGVVSVALLSGGAVGPWVAGLIFDWTGSYRPAFILSIGLCLVSIVSIWKAAPRKVRVVPGKIRPA